MKLNCGPTAEAKRERLENWHRWFAWHPVRVGEKECRWLEIVWRKGSYGSKYGWVRMYCGVVAWKYRTEENHEQILWDAYREKVSKYHKSAYDLAKLTSPPLVSISVPADPPPFHSDSLYVPKSTTKRGPARGSKSGRKAKRKAR